MLSRTMPRCAASALLACTLSIAASLGAETTESLRFGPVAPLSAGAAAAYLSRMEAEAKTAFAHTEAALSLAWAKAENVEIFEGLPRSSERELLETERKKPLRRFDDQDFYAAPQPIGAEQRTELAGLLGADSLRTFRGSKLCGGFHADYAVRWTWDDGSSSSVLLLCFGCQEARLLSGGRHTTDLTASGAAALKTFFAAFRKERPAPQPVVPK